MLHMKVNVGSWGCLFRHETQKNVVPSFMESIRLWCSNIKIIFVPLFSEEGGEGFL
jgi:hypothetical protein